MDAQKFGTFLAAMRKENNMTQLELANKLQVTDKAVSKWERGLGLPDIHTIEPLAEALGLSVLEVMRAERISDPAIPSADASDALTDAFELVKIQRKAERNAILKITGCIAVILFTVFLIDEIGWMGFTMAYLPIIFLLAGISLVAYGFWRKTNHLPCAQTFFLAILMLFVPVGIAALLFAAGALGLGPVPS